MTGSGQSDAGSVQPPPRLDGERVRRTLRERLAGRALDRPPRGGRPSAVLIPLFEREGEAHAWLLRRTKALRSHSGQVAFPGGKCEPGDPTPLATALREAEEEIGLPAARVEVLGRLDDHSTITRFAIAPFVAWLAADAVAGWEPVPSQAEVARIFAAPLRVFLGQPGGLPPMRGYRVDGELVWGATARIARDLARLAVAESPQ